MVEDLLIAMKILNSRFLDEAPQVNLSTLLDIALIPQSRETGVLKSIRFFRNSEDFLIYHSLVSDVSYREGNLDTQAKIDFFINLNNASFHDIYYDLLLPDAGENNLFLQYKAKIKHGLISDILAARVLDSGTRSFNFLTDTLFNDMVELTHSFGQETLIFEALEEFFNISPTQRTALLRIIFIELERVIKHLYWIKKHLDKIGLIYQSECALKLLNECMSLVFDENRVFILQNIFGGFKADIPKDWQHRCFKTIEKISTNIDKFFALCIKSPAFRDRLEIGHFNLKEALESSITGPCARSAGINIDARVFGGCPIYKELEFAPLLAVSGTLYDEFLVRSQEIKQSFKMIISLVDGLVPMPITIEYEHKKVEDTFLFKEKELSDGVSSVFVGNIGDKCTVVLTTPLLEKAFLAAKRLKGCSLSDASLLLCQFEKIDGELI